MPRAGSKRQQGESLAAVAAGAGVALSTAAEILRAPDGARYATETPQRVLETAELRPIR